MLSEIVFFEEGILSEIIFNIVSGVFFLAGGLVIMFYKKKNTPKRQRAGRNNLSGRRPFSFFIGTCYLIAGVFLICWAVARGSNL